MKNIASIVQKHGLSVNVEKCRRIDVLGEGQLLFAGIPLSTNGRVNRVEEITKKFKDELSKLKGIKLTLH